MGSPLGLVKIKQAREFHLLEKKVIALGIELGI